MKKSSPRLTNGETLALNENGLSLSGDEYFISLAAALHIAPKEALGNITTSRGTTFKEPDEWRAIYN